MLKLTEFDFNLPNELIAQFPVASRSQSRLLEYRKDSKVMQHLQSCDIPKLLNSNCILVFNNTRVIPARLFGTKLTGGKVEVLIEKIIDGQSAIVMLKSNKSIQVNTTFQIQDVMLEVYGKEEGLFFIKIINNKSIQYLLDNYGEIPLPPYMNRSPNEQDKKRYQTVFAKTDGAIAAPTAGLHFDENLLQELLANQIQMEYLTLHVGIGTFLPVKVQDINEHKMHKEFFEISQETCDKLNAAKQAGKKIIAVGTTVVRALESATINGKLEASSSQTDIFIYPGYKFKFVDKLFTNFHLPKSTLLMLVSAFISKDETLNLYKEAILNKYRFYSYGDLMFLN